MTMIALENMSITLGEFSLHDVNLRISKGEYLVIMGPSGAGKTVLLETIAGLGSRTAEESSLMETMPAASPRRTGASPLSTRTIPFSLI